MIFLFQPLFPGTFFAVHSRHIFCQPKGNPLISSYLLPFLTATFPRAFRISTSLEIFCPKGMNLIILVCFSGAILTSYSFRQPIRQITDRSTTKRRFLIFTSLPSVASCEEGLFLFTEYNKFQRFVNIHSFILNSNQPKLFNCSSNFPSFSCCCPNLSCSFATTSFGAFFTFFNYLIDNSRPQRSKSKQMLILKLFLFLTNLR